LTKEQTENNLLSQREAMAKRNETCPNRLSASKSGTIAMLAAFATLAFLVAMWLAFGAALLTLARRNDKIVAALKGRSPLAIQPVVLPRAVRVTQLARLQRPMRAQPEWRAAA
jgi:hypothetical protein